MNFANRLQENSSKILQFCYGGKNCENHQSVTGKTAKFVNGLWEKLWISPINDGKMKQNSLIGCKKKKSWKWSWETLQNLSIGCKEKFFAKIVNRSWKKKTKFANELLEKICKICQFVPRKKSWKWSISCGKKCEIHQCITGKPMKFTNRLLEKKSQNFSFGHKKKIGKFFNQLQENHKICQWGCRKNQEIHEKDAGKIVKFVKWLQKRNCKNYWSVTGKSLKICQLIARKKLWKCSISRRKTMKFVNDVAGKTAKFTNRLLENVSKSINWLQDKNCKIHQLVLEQNPNIIGKK